MELTPTLQWIPRIYVTVFRELSNLPQVTSQNGRFSGPMLALQTRRFSILSPDTSLLKNILHAIYKLLCSTFCVVTKNLSYCWECLLRYPTLSQAILNTIYFSHDFLSFTRSKLSPQLFPEIPLHRQLPLFWLVVYTLMVSDLIALSIKIWPYVLDYTSFNTSKGYALIDILINWHDSDSIFWVAQQMI